MKRLIETMPRQGRRYTHRKKISKMIAPPFGSVPHTRTAGCRWVPWVALGVARGWRILCVCVWRSKSLAVLEVLQ